MPHPLLEHMHKKIEINQTKIKGGCKLERKMVTYNSMSDLPLATLLNKVYVEIVYSFSEYLLRMHGATEN